MSAEVSAAVAAWIAAGFAGVFGIAGFVVGLVGLHHARKAKEAAAGANLIAKDANSIARGANTLSEKANDIAQEANDIARDGEKRATEQHDVTWDCRWERPGVYVMRNEGRDTAFNVRAIVDVDDEVNEVSAEEVRGGDALRIEMPLALAAWKDEQREKRRRSEERDNRLGILLNSPMDFMTHSMRDRVYWTTGSGTPKTYDKFFPMGSLEP
ncbi:hypothetical protein ACIQLJ_08485 [Microbacterium sp. NPDC091313]